MNAVAKALEALRSSGWSKGRYVAPDGSHCMLGALNVALGLPDEYVLGTSHPAHTAIANVVAEQYPDRACFYRQVDNSWDLSVATFNDDPDTTFDDIKLVLEKAAIALDEVV